MARFMVNLPSAIGEFRELGEIASTSTRSRVPPLYDRAGSASINEGSPWL
jgi:hypothetical protein